MLVSSTIPSNLSIPGCCCFKFLKRNGQGERQTDRDGGRERLKEKKKILKEGIQWQGSESQSKVHGAGLSASSTHTCPRWHSTTWWLVGRYNHYRGTELKTQVTLRWVSLSNTRTKEVLFVFFSLRISSPRGAAIFSGSLFTKEEQKKIGSWRI